MFDGEYYHTIDKKGRVILPAKFRDEFKDGLWITISPEKCLWIFNKQTWLQLADKWGAVPRAKLSVRDIARLRFGRSFSDTLDNQGRVTIPPSLREKANLTKDIVILGAEDRLEIWNKEDWETYREKIEATYAEIVEGTELEI